MEVDDLDVISCNYNTVSESVCDNENLSDNNINHELRNLLSSWGFIDMYEYFLSMDVTVEVLKFIHDDDIKDIFANKSLGVRVVFKHQLRQWRSKNETCTPSDVVSLVKYVKNVFEEMQEQQKLFNQIFLEYISERSTAKEKCSDIISSTPSPSTSNPPSPT